MKGSYLCLWLRAGKGHGELSCTTVGLLRGEIREFWEVHGLEKPRWTVFSRKSQAYTQMKTDYGFLLPFLHSRNGEQRPAGKEDEKFKYETLHGAETFIITG